MTPEQYQQFESMQQQINQISNTLKLLSNSATIPKEYDAAFRARFIPKGFVSASAKTAASETQSFITSVNFGASSTTSANGAKNMDGFITITDPINGTTYNVPFYI